MMSASPLPVVAFGGFSDLPSSMAFICSAEAEVVKAEVVKATDAPNASVTSATLVLDIMLSLLKSRLCAASERSHFPKTIRFQLYSVRGFTQYFRRKLSYSLGLEEELRQPLD